MVGAFCLPKFKEGIYLEVKINREIRNYTEVMFFGLSLRQFIFLSAPVLWDRLVFPAETVCGDGNCVVDVQFGSSPLCGSRLYQVQWNDRREIHLCVDKIRVPYAEEARVSFRQRLLGADEAGYGKEAEEGI